MNSIYTGIYRLDIRNHNSDIAHLYEHLLIRSFENHLSQKGFSNYLYGWLHGETFRDICFLEFGFYSKEVCELFSKFISSDEKIDFTLFDAEIERIAVEERCLIDIIDKKKILQSLKRLDVGVWINLESTTPAIEQIRADSDQRDDDIMRYKKSAKSFRDVSIMFGIQDASLEEKAVLLRFIPVIYDALTRSMYDLGLYERDSSPLRYQEEHDAMVACMIFSLKRGSYSIQELEKKAQHIISTLDLTAHRAELSQFAEAYVHTPTWNSFPIEYYKYTGILVTKKQIAELMTAEKTEALLKKLTVKASPANETHYSACRD